MTVAPVHIGAAAVHAPDWLALSGVEAFLRSIDFLDIRISNLARGPSKAEMDLSGLAIRCKCEVRIHSWVGVRSTSTDRRLIGTSAATAKDGTTQGEQAALAAWHMSATSFSANAERDVWRGQRVDGEASRHQVHPGAEPYLQAFAGAFRELAAEGVEVRYCGFAVPRWHFRGAPQVGKATRDCFDHVEVMAYQSTREALATTMDRAAREWPEHAAESRLTPWVGVGRIDAAGRVVGNAEASLELAREHRAIVWYVGFGAIDQVLTGHDRHRSLLSLARELRPEVCA